MNRFKEYFTVPFGTVEVEADEASVLSIRMLQAVSYTHLTLPTNSRV